MLSNYALAQDTTKSELKNIIDSLNKFNTHLSIEKLFNTDKPHYFQNDTLWLKAYLMEASYFNASTKSGILYVEIADDSNIVVKRIMLPVFNGLAYGQIHLNQEEMLQGSYSLRAYTNWMRNFGEDYVFKKRFYINGIADNDWLVNYNARLEKQEADKENLFFNLQLKRSNGTPVGLRELQMRLMEGKKVLARGDAETDIDGLLKVNFTERLSSRNLTLNIQDMRKGEGNRNLTVPILLNRPDNIDLQFMPEGGHLVANLPAIVAFKAINENGMGTDVLGKVYNSKSEEVAEFSSKHKGIGVFSFIPANGETYSARIKLADGSYKNYSLPEVKNSGIVLNIKSEFQTELCEISIDATNDVIAKGNTYYLIGQARGVVCYAASFRLTNNPLKLRISKKNFPSGVARFTLTGADKIALNERIVYIDHNDNLVTEIVADKSLYKQRDSVLLNIKVSDIIGKPIRGSFSIAVTDDNQVKMDSSSEVSIIANMLLTSEIKGNIEDPGYYLNTQSFEKWRNLDYLLLTQGWVAYSWEEAFKPAKILTYEAEREFLVKGRVTNVFNKPVVNSGINLFSKKPFLILDTISNDKGAFTFKGIFPADTAIFFIQARNKRAKSFNVGIEMDEFKPPVFNTTAQRYMPWYVNIDTARLLIVKKHDQLQKDMERVLGGNMLKEVVVVAKKIVKDSKNLNGPGQADYIIGTEELEKAGKSTLGDLLTKNIPGFTIRANKYGQLFYRISDRLVHLIIDGIETEFFKSEQESLYEHLKYYFDYYDAEEIKGIEVMTSGKYQMSYTQQFLDPLAIPWDHAFIEVTTRGGKGPFVKKNVGTYLYKPMPFTLAKEFYVPKYNPGSIANMTDVRSTIFWKPDIITNENGEATIKFSTADIPGTYTMIFQGTDMNGNIGYQNTKLRVKSK